MKRFTLNAFGGPGTMIENETGEWVRAEDVAWRWIPVSERLPERDLEAAIVCSDGLISIAFYNKERGWGVGTMVSEDVTHWMELPELPK